MHTRDLRQIWLHPALLVLVSTGCVAHWHDVPLGTLATDLTVIEAEDHSFKIVAGQAFSPPFHNACPDSATPDAFAAAEVGGARRVRVTYPGLEQPLYGVLALCRTHPDFNGPASRSYQVVIPEEYVKATEGGRASVVFETYPVDGANYRAWILWLSREPLPVIKLNANDVQLFGQAPTRNNAFIASFASSQYGDGTHIDVSKPSREILGGGALSGAQLEYGTFDGLEINARLRYLTSSLNTASVPVTGPGGIGTGAFGKSETGLSELGGEFAIGYDYELERAVHLPTDFHLGVGATLGVGGGAYLIGSNGDAAGEAWAPLRLNISARYSMVVAQLTLAEEAHLAGIEYGGGWPLVFEGGLGVAF